MKDPTFFMKFLDNSLSFGDRLSLDGVVRKYMYYPLKGDKVN